MKTAWKGYGKYYSASDTHGGTYSLQHDLFAVGAGYLDVAAALSSTDLAPATLGNAKSPMVGQDPLTHQIYIVADTTSVWNTSVVWGNSAVWGSSVLSGTLVTAEPSAWGNSQLSGTTLTTPYT